jgi:hypothetical protein
VGVLARVLVAVAAVVVLGWLAVLLRDERVGSVAAHRLFYEPDLPRSELRQELDRLRDADALSPDTKWQMRRASYLVVHGALREAADAAEAIARKEPANIDAWSTLYEATRGWDPRRAALARREVLRLNPLALQRRSAQTHGAGPSPARHPSP